MDSSSSNNLVVSDIELKEKLRSLHEMLGEGLTDVANDAMEYGYQFKTDAEKMLKYLSQTASQFSIVLISVRGKKSEFSNEELADYERVKELTAVIGNLQDRLNRIIKSTIKVNSLNEEISTQGMDLAEYVLEAQSQFRSVRSSIDGFSFLKNTSNLLNMYKQDKPSENSYSNLN